MAPSSFRVSEPGRGQPTADPGGGDLMVSGGEIPAAPPDGTVQPGLGRGTSLGVGVKPSAPSKGKGRICSRSPPGSAIGMAAAPLRPAFPRAASPCDPRAARTLGPAARTSPPCPRWLGRTAVGRPARAPAAAVGRALGVQRAVSAGGLERGGGRLRGSGHLLCLRRLRRRPAVGRWCQDPAGPARTA